MIDLIVNILIISNIIAFVQLSFIILLNCILLRDANCWSTYCSLLETIFAVLMWQCSLMLKIFIIIFRLKRWNWCRMVILLEPLFNCGNLRVNLKNTRGRLGWILGSSCSPNRRNRLNWRRNWILEVGGIQKGRFLRHFINLIHVVLDAIRRRNATEMVAIFLWWLLCLIRIDDLHN